MFFLSDTKRKYFENGTKRKFLYRFTNPESHLKILLGKYFQVEYRIGFNFTEWFMHPLVWPHQKFVIFYSSFEKKFTVCGVVF
jgi:hypothetical protein